MGRLETGLSLRCPFRKSVPVRTASKFLRDNYFLFYDHSQRTLLSYPCFSACQSSRLAPQLLRASPFFVSVRLDCFFTFLSPLPAPRAPPKQSFAFPAPDGRP